MVIIQHAGDPVKTETVETVLLKPVTAIGHEEMQHLVFCIIETEGIPGHMFPAGSVMKILPGTPIQTAQSLVFIFYRMGMHQVHDNRNSGFMSSIDQPLQVIRGPESGGGCEKTGNVVSEGPVIRVLLYGHDLDHVITPGNDMGG